MAIHRHSLFILGLAGVVSAVLLGGAIWLWRGQQPPPELVSGPSLGADASRSTSTDRVHLATPSEDASPRDTPLRPIDAAKAPAPIVPLSSSEDPEARIARMKSRALEWEKAEAWETTYAKMGSQELERVRANIEASIDEASKAELTSRLATGQYQVISEEEAHKGGVFNPYDVYWVECRPSGPCKKCTLPESGFSEVFKKKALSAWLNDRIHTR